MNRWLCGIGLVLGLGAVSLRAECNSCPADTWSEVRSNDVLGIRLERIVAEHRRRPDLERYRESLSDYPATQLSWLLVGGPPPVRRAAAAALGEQGPESTVPFLISALHDADQDVRRLAEESCWKIWRRSGTPEQQAALTHIVQCNQRRDFTTAIAQASLLLCRFPNLPEAWNQRAIANFQMKHYEAAIRDCRQALELNPHHFGAAAGLAQCLLKTRQREEALQVLHLAQQIHPHLPGVSEQITVLRRELQQSTSQAAKEDAATK